MNKVKFAELDLKQPIMLIRTDPNYQQIDILVHWGYQPVGMLELANEDGGRVYQPDELYEKGIELLCSEMGPDAFTGNLDAINQLTESVLPPISVIVCTRDRCDSLQRCLESLKCLDYPRFEVVVIDNCSQDPTTAQLAEQYGYHCFREDKLGLDRARNRGIKEAQYDLIAFIDDDAVAHPGWLRGLAFGFKNPEAAAVTGLVLPGEIETQAQADFERYGGMGKGYQRAIIRREQLGFNRLFWASGFGVGTNMAFRKDLFATIGDFDVALDVGTPTNGGGDIEFFYRLVSSGHVLIYEPAAILSHFHRRDYESLESQIYNNGRSFLAYLLTIARNSSCPRFRLLCFVLYDWILGWLVRRLIKSLILLDRRTFWMVITEMRGALSGPGAYWRSQKIARQYALESPQ
jgi:glycosyltransferase involved in cell wall biosynthesis